MFAGFGAVLVEPLPHLHRQLPQLLDRQPGRMLDQHPFPQRPIVQAAAGTGLDQFPDDHARLLDRHPRPQITGSVAGPVAGTSLRVRAVRAVRA